MTIVRLGANVVSSSPAARQFFFIMTMLEQPKVSGVTKKAKEDSAITRHFRESPACIPAIEECTGLFSVIAQARHQEHLDVLEALFIKKLAPSLCCQKQFSRTCFCFSSEG